MRGATERLGQQLAAMIVVLRAITWCAITAAVLIGVAGCTRLELQSKATAYNEAIAESTNEQILMNVLRASQRAPMSFTGLGDVASSPNLSGDASGTFNFNPLALTSSALNPSVHYGGGFSAFNMTNLNREEFMAKIRQPVDRKLISFFEAQNWPEELIELMFIGSFKIERVRYATLIQRSERTCATPSDERTQSICEFIRLQEAEYEAAGCYAYGESAIFLNTARDLCGMARFQIVLRRMRLLRLSPLNGDYFQYITRSPQAILYYLGELVAGQLYSARRYVPTTYVGTTEGRRLVPLFEVREGTSEDAAVQASYGNRSYYIPRPQLGTVDEARSLQVLDFVTQVIAAHTTSKDLPKVNTVGVLNLQ